MTDENKKQVSLSETIEVFRRGVAELQRHVDFASEFLAGGDEPTAEDVMFLAAKYAHEMGSFTKVMILVKGNIDE